MIADKLQHIADRMPLIYDAGKMEAEQVCRSKHFATVITGDDGTELSFHLDFEPDRIDICCFDPDLRMYRGMIAFCHFDIAALGQGSGFHGIASGPSNTTVLGTYSNALTAASNLPKRYKRDADGTVTIGNLIYNDLAGRWGKGMEYVISAAKVHAKSDKQRLTEIVERLPEGGTYNIHIQEAKKDAAFTDAEWNALIATKPTYTFVMT